MHRWTLSDKSNRFLARCWKRLARPLLNTVVHGSARIHTIGNTIRRLVVKRSADSACRETLQIAERLGLSGARVASSAACVMRIVSASSAAVAAPLRQQRPAALTAKIRS